ncbi:Qat anti-phage system associated protein QatB [Halomonas sp. PAMB 3264]|uniref:Qat anti-phage system associated protein QatB n=1 Tax=Halomonas sp. PAMB 3264 TaxID=3075222 RepID=UPI00289CD2CC|nr:Qat anti-phage system associated protein QatB [Halomonas sp. PAMB 3264]WNL41600.1 Qat anti-phage system associated protein QatB [Halomonas sp. PAMB 3264]
MGTSQNSDGPSKGVPIVPSWTPPLPPIPLELPQSQEPPAPPASEPPDSEEDQVDQDGQSDGPPEGDNEPNTAPQSPPPLAPPGRFGGARKGLGDYARTGDRSGLQRSLKHYVKHGYGGAKTTTARFGGTAAVASILGGTLQSVAEGTSQTNANLIDPVLLKGRSASEVMDALVEAVRPVDGTQDAEAERASIRGSLSDVLVKYPNADLLNLAPEERAYAIERFTAMDVFHRYELDLGKTVQEKASSALVAVRRLKEIKVYIKECVSASFRSIAATGVGLTTGRISQVVTQALQETFEVFEGYIE